MVTVHKFGGTSVAGPSQFARVCGVVKDLISSDNPVVVVSAMAGITNQLYSAIQAAVLVGDFELIMNRIRQIHFDCIEELETKFGLKPNPGLKQEMDSDIARLIELLETVKVFGGTCHMEISDIVAGFGEIWSSRILAAMLQSHGVLSVAYNARDFLFLSQLSGKDVRIDWKKSVAPSVGEGEVPVITGFLATSANGVPTTLKRNGSDFSGAIVANLFNASKLTIWTDVDGIYSADPRQVKGQK